MDENLYKSLSVYRLTFPDMEWYTLLSLFIKVLQKFRKNLEMQKEYTLSMFSR